MFQIDGIHLLLSQDDGSVVLPFISTRLSAGEAVIEGTPNELRMKLMINVGVNFFNSHRSLWDSLVQYWPVHIEVNHPHTHRIYPLKKHFIFFRHPRREGPLPTEPSRSDPRTVWT